MVQYVIFGEIFNDKGTIEEVQEHLQSKYDATYGPRAVSVLFQKPAEHIYKFVWKRNLAISKKKAMGVFDAELITGLEVSSVKPLEFSDIPASTIKSGHIPCRRFVARYIHLMRKKYNLKDNHYQIDVQADNDELQLTIRFLPIKGVVYSLSNNVKGKEFGWKYIGETVDEAGRRRNWKKETHNYANQRLIEARAKWGCDNFEYKILAKVDSYYDKQETKSELLMIEAQYIKQLNTTVKGYNESHLGTGNSGRTFTETHRRNIGKASAGRFHSKETRAKISKALTGKHRLESTKAAISAGNSGKKRTDEQRKAQSDRQKGKKPMAAILGAKKKRAELGHGFTKGIKQTTKAKANMKAAQQLRGTSVQAIAPDGTTKDYNTMLDAAKDLGMGVGSVANNLKSGGICKNGYCFKKL